MRLPLPALAAALLAGCGYVAGPLAPLANIPARVNDLAALQRGDRLIVHFTVPTLTTEGATILVPPTLDLRIGPVPSPFNSSRWVAGAKTIPPVKPAHNLAEYEIPVTEWVGQQVALLVRVVGANGKDAGWSNWVILPVVPPPPQPVNLQAEVTPAGLRLTWQARGEHFRVLRSTAASQHYEVLATVTEPQWTDPNIIFGTPYRYQVQTFVPLGNNREAQSELSDPLTTTPEPLAPAAPTGLRAVPGPNSIELSWDGNTEPDVIGYRLYRGTPGETLQPIADVGVIPAYSDHAVQHARNYRYAVTALSRSGRESPQSTANDVTMP